MTCCCHSSTTPWEWLSDVLQPLVFPVAGPHCCHSAPKPKSKLEAKRMAPTLCSTVSFSWDSPVFIIRAGSDWGYFTLALKAYGCNMNTRYPHVKKPKRFADPLKVCWSLFFFWGHKRFKGEAHYSPKANQKKWPNSHTHTLSLISIFMNIFQS